jgi:hypothetical protein
VHYLEWIGGISFATSHYCPGIGSCTHGAYGAGLEQLRVDLRHIQIEEGWEGNFVIDPMHIGKGSGAVDHPHHLLIVGGPFMDAET